MNKVSFFRGLLNLLFPFRGRRRLIEEMDTDTFCARTTPAETSDLAEGHYAALSYRDPLVREAVWALKYHGSRNAAVLLSEGLAETLVELLGDVEVFEEGGAYVIVPVPLWRGRERERGFNQVVLLGKALAERAGALGITLELAPDVLSRTRHTKNQTALSRDERLTNMHEAFSCVLPEQYTGATFIVIDDVTTTGATLHEARRALRQAGARRIICLAAAH